LPPFARGENALYLIHTHTDPMDYETYIDIKRYSTDCRFSYTLRVIDVMNMDYDYSGTAWTLDDVMDCIRLHLKQHQN
jgi:hypothetical protein